MLVLLKPKHLALFGAACAYVAAGNAAFHLVQAVAGDPDLAQAIAAGLALPLVAPLWLVTGWIDRHL